MSLYPGKSIITFLFIIIVNGIAAAVQHHHHHHHHDHHFFNNTADKTQPWQWMKNEATNKCLWKVYEHNNTRKQWPLTAKLSANWAALCSKRFLSEVNASLFFFIFNFSSSRASWSPHNRIHYCQADTTCTILIAAGKMPLISKWYVPDIKKYMDK